MSLGSVNGSRFFETAAPLNLNTASAPALPPGIGFVPPPLSLGVQMLDHVVSVLRLAVIDYIYITREDFRNEATIYGSIGNLLIILADIGGTLLFLSDIKILDLALLSSTVGGVTLMSVSFLIPAVSTLYLISYTLKGINAVCILCDEKAKKNMKHQAMIDIAIALSQIALAIFILTGVLSATPMMVLGIVAGVFGLVGLSHNLFYIECAS